MPRWPDNIIDSVFYLYPCREAAEHAENVGACGFLLSMPWDNPNAPDRHRHVYAISNYHAAVSGGCSIIRLNTRDGKNYIVETDPSEWFWQRGADVAVYRIGNPAHQFDASAIWKYAHSPIDKGCTSHILREFQIGPGDDVVSVGRFVDVYGLQRNTPLVRSGIIASDGVISVKTSDEIPWDKEDVWIVEMRSRSGFSGSPVYVYISPWQPNFIDAPERKYGNFFYGPWLLGVHSSQIPGSIDKKSLWSGMISVVPYSALEKLLMNDTKVKQDRAEYEQRFLNVPTMEAEGVEEDETNPKHKEDFMRLVDAAAKRRPPSDRT